MAKADAEAALAAEKQRMEDDLKALAANLAAKKQELAQLEAEAGEKKKDKKKEKKEKKGKSAPLIDTQPEQGCRDFPPEDYRFRHWLFSTFRRVAKQFAFEEYDAPVLEPENLYVVKAGKGDAKAGEEILDQMFNFTTKDGHKVALRPEMTPTLARLIMQKGQSLMLPIKWFSIPQCWRYEAIVRGRKREHFQWNMDIWGVPTVNAEAELLSAIITFMKEIGLTSKDVGIRVNSRKLLQEVLKKANVPDAQFAPVCIIIDKVDKYEREEIVEMLKEKGLDDTVITTILESLKIKDIEGVKKVAGDDSDVAKELGQLFDSLASYGLSDWVQLDASVVRGLAYYTGVVFEGFDRAGNLRAICGGGRYDALMNTFGHSQSIPAAGFGFGDCVIMELLKDKKLLPTLTSSVEYIVIPFDEKMRPNAVSVLTSLRNNGVPCDMVLEKKRKPAQAFSYADRRGAQFAVLVAPSEWESGKVTVKDLMDPEDTRGVQMSIDDLLKKATAGNQ
eukprot:TRINITY_DN18082_c0_g3_i1.p1 TRINITY_DN18082_c0_g3~~TRINITY_DN18082_c0_g3_i1.p1  ORF type:complete len:504 (+),score=283.71 TRINITY_DN18082_c0_g3_i1:54-1565(+)